MPLRESLFTQFHAVATATLKLKPDDATAFASHIVNANDAIHVIGQLCTGPNALQSKTLAAMLERWFGLLPEYEFPSKALGQKPGQAAAPPGVLEANALMLHGRVFEVCISERGLSESAALQVAQHVRRAAPAFFALEQRCRAPVKHTQRVLCGTLRAALGGPYQHAREAAGVYLGGQV